MSGCDSYRPIACCAALLRAFQNLLPSGILTDFQIHDPMHLAYHVFVAAPDAVGFIVNSVDSVCLSLTLSNLLAGVHFVRLSTKVALTEKF